MLRLNFCAKLKIFASQQSGRDCPPSPSPGTLAVTLPNNTLNNDKMENINIEKLTVNNIDLLQKIGRQTFYETFSESNTEENMKVIWK